MKHSESHIQMVADTLMPGFVPQDPNETTLIFHFTLPPDESYRVEYLKSAKNVWEFSKAEKVAR